MITVADVMTRNPIRVAPDLPLRDVIGLMKAHGCRQLPVVDGERLVGIISDRDVRLAMNSPLVQHDRLEDEELLSHITAADCMTPDPLTIEATALAVEAADLMRRYKFGGLPVLDHGELVGIVTVTDILVSFIQLAHTRGESAPS